MCVRAFSSSVAVNVCESFASDGILVTSAATLRATRPWRIWSCNTVMRALAASVVSDDPTGDQSERIQSRASLSAVEALFSASRTLTKMPVRVGNSVTVAFEIGSPGVFVERVNNGPRAADRERVHSGHVIVGHG